MLSPRPECERRKTNKKRSGKFPLRFCAVRILGFQGVNDPLAGRGAAPHGLKAQRSAGRRAAAPNSRKYFCAPGNAQPAFSKTSKRGEGESSLQWPCPKQSLGQWGNPKRGFPSFPEKITLPVAGIPIYPKLRSQGPGRGAQGWRGLSAEGFPLEL